MNFAPTPLSHGTLRIEDAIVGGLHQTDDPVILQLLSAADPVVLPLLNVVDGTGGGPYRDDAHCQNHAFDRVPVDELDRTLPEGSSPGKDGFVGQESIQV